MMKELKFFDVNCRAGIPQNGTNGVSDAAELLAEMDRYGVEKALVRSMNIAKGALASNQFTAEFLRQDTEKRLTGVWCMLPSQCDELPAPEAWFDEMSAARIGALTLSPFEHRYHPCKLTLGKLMKKAAERKIPVLLDAFAGAGKLKELYAFAEEFKGNILIYIESWGKWGSDRYIRPLLENYPNFHFDLAGYWVPEGVSDLVQKYGPERLLYGSGFPFYHQGSSMPMLKYSGGLSPEEQMLIAGGNLERLLKEAKL